jgi:hypothetical protein
VKRWKEGDKALLEITFGKGDDYGDVCWVFLPSDGITNMRPRSSQVDRERILPVEER